MIYEYPQEKRAELLPLFQGIEYLDALALGVLLSELGELFVDDLDKPKNAILIYEEMMIVVFGGSGEGETAKELFSKMPKRAAFIFPNKKWEELIKENYGDKLRSQTRTKVSSANLDLKHIRKIKSNIPDGYEIVKINNEIIDMFEENTIKKINRFCGSVDKFRKDGFGFCALYDGKIAAEISNGGISYKNSFEIDIETHPDHRRKGLATLLAAFMIEYSLENGLDPRWDAANKPSADLAFKLGYTDPEEYEVLIYIEE
ncbi:MAG: GNAT family N-acetyltransferase [Asgard group archaeon]|nr:GNAT family N-acetyltransferase [Asgard group archaeon]